MPHHHHKELNSECHAIHVLWARVSFLQPCLEMGLRGRRGSVSCPQHLHPHCSGLPAHRQDPTNTPTSPPNPTPVIIQLSLAKNNIHFLSPVFCRPRVWAWLTCVLCSGSHQGMSQAAFSSEAQLEKDLLPGCLRLLAESISLWL